MAKRKTTAKAKEDSKAVDNGSSTYKVPQGNELEEMPSTPNIEIPEEAKKEKKELYEEEPKTTNLKVVNVEVPEEDLQKREADILDEFSVYAKSEKGKVWTKDIHSLKKVEGRKFTLAGTLYNGELKD
jgi:hypothetical protein